MQASGCGRLIAGWLGHESVPTTRARTFDHVFTRATPRDPQTWATFQAQPVPAWAIDYQTMGKALG